MAAIFPLPHRPIPDIPTGDIPTGDIDDRQRTRRARHGSTERTHLQQHRPVGRRSLVLIDGGRAVPRTESDRLRRGAVARRAVRRRALGVLLAGFLSIVTVMGVAVIFSFVDAASQPPAASPSTGAVGAPLDDVGVSAGSVVVVQDGDTLTSIARRLQPSGDIRGLVDRLAAAHGPAPLQAGERVAVGSSIRAGGSS